MLAPMTNTQSYEDGTLSDDEFHWLTMRAKGGFGLTMTCASHVQENGKGFPGQLGIFDDKHIAGHRRLTDAIRRAGSLSVVQLHHAGIRSPKELVNNNNVGPSVHDKSGSRALSLQEVKSLKEDFINAGLRARESGYDGVEIHGAHGYILSQFLSPKYNRREDAYGGSLENRSRLIFEIIEGIRSVCGADFLIGLRLSPERFGMDLGEVKTLCQQLVDRTSIDFLDISLWDVFKDPEDSTYAGKSLMAHFAALNFGKVSWTVAGHIRTGADVRSVIDAGVDFVSIGRAAILHYNFPKLVMEDKNFQPVDLPVTADYLKEQGLGKNFIDYMGRWPDFVAK